MSAEELQHGDLQDGQLIVRSERSLRRITLNRPKALNALTLDMAVRMSALLRQWAVDPEVGAVLLDGAGERAFCAGGDIRALYDAAKSGGSLPVQFWTTEYRLDVLIARYTKPLIVVMDGLVMGGGVGLSTHAAHRVVTERSAIAMPEVGIGYFPDVGACFLLARSPGYVGTYLALTGDRIGAADAIDCGLADINISAAKLAELPAALAECRTAGDASKTLRELSAAAPAGKIAAARVWIDACYGADNVEDIVARLAATNDDAAHSALEAMRKASPTSLKVALQNIRSALSFKRVEESFQQDFRISLACIAGHDFIEGIRAQIVDKDRNPVWAPKQLADVTPQIVDRHFKSVGAQELTFVQ
jgi:enoyl-CoA hydratase